MIPDVLRSTALAVIGLGLLTLSALGQAPDVTVFEDDGDYLVVTTDPIELPVHEGSGGHEHHGLFPPIKVVEIPFDCHLTGFDYEVVDGEGNVLSSKILHHLNLINPEHRELFLPISQRVAAAGSETGPQSMPSLLFGYPARQGQRFVFSAMLHNPTGVHEEAVSLRFKVQYSEGKPWPFFDIYPFQIDVAFPAGDKSFDLPPGKSHRSWEGSPVMAGRVLMAGSHLHEHATHITFEDVTADEMLWTGYPVVGDNNSLEGVTIGDFYWKFGLEIVPEHAYRVTVYYDNQTGDTLPEGGMGVIAGAFLPSDGAEWPTADNSDPLYVTDRSHFMREIRGKFDPEEGSIVSATHAGMDHSYMDHSGMDHSGMDHSGMDHSGMDHSGMDHSGMEPEKDASADAHDHGTHDHGSSEGSQSAPDASSGSNDHGEHSH
jgi:hypothetical protein